MKTSLRRAAAFAILVVVLVPSLGQADEPKVEDKKAVEATPAKEEPKAVKKEVAKKPKAAAAIEIEALAAPFVEALADKLDLNAGNAQADAQLKQWIPQFTEQFRPILTVELNFIRQMCDLTPEQRPKIKAAGEASVTEAARKMAEMRVRQMRVAVAQNSQPDPRRIIRDALAKVLKETLTPEQMAKYTEEATKRTAIRKRAAILSVVARLDSTMCLTAEQRDKITESISAGWQDKWEQWLFMSIYGDQYFPMVPDQHVVTHLNTEQKSVWSGLQKADFGHWGGDGQVPENDGWWGDEPAKADAAGAAGAVIRFFGGNVGF